MYCPNCGRSDQQEKTYCRQCGEYLPSLGTSKALAWGGLSPKTQVNTSLFLNAISAVASIVIAVLLFGSIGVGRDISFLITVSAALLLTIGLWQIANFTVGLKLRKHFTKPAPDEDKQIPREILNPATTNELLPEADFSNVVPPSVTDHTTRHLVTPLRDPSSKS